MFFFNGDARFFYSENLPYFTGIPQAWDASLNTGVGQNALHMLWINTYLNLTATFSYLGIPWIFIHIIFWILPAFVFSFYFAFKLFRFLIPDYKISALFSGFIYTFNTYLVLVLLGGQAGVGLAYAFTPFVLLRLFQLFAKCTLQNSLYAGLALSILLLFDPRWVYMVMISVLLYWLIKGYIRFINTRNLVYWFLLPTVVVIILHNYWIVPLLVFKNSNPIQGIGNSDSFAFFSFADFSHSFSLLHPNWPENIFGKTYFIEPLFILIPLTAFASLLFMKRNKEKEKESEMNFQTKNKNEQYLEFNKLKTNKNILFFVFLGLSGAFLAKGINEPLGNINNWIYTKIPGMMMFRDPTKWYTLVAISYAILVPFSMSNFSQYIVNSLILKRIGYRIFQQKAIKLKSRKKQLNQLTWEDRSPIALKLIIIASVLVWIFIHVGTYFKYPQRQFISVIPDEYLQLKEFIKNENIFYRTLWIPQWQRFGYFSDLNPAIGRGELRQITKPQIMARHLNNEKVMQKLRDIGVRYIILPYDSERELFSGNGSNQERVYSATRAELDKNAQLHRRTNFGKILVYEISNSKDRFWTITSTDIKWKQISASEYELKLENDKINQLVVFSDSFDANWVAYNGETRIYSKIFSGSLNSFMVPIGIKELNILYEPQIWVKRGLIISSLSFILLPIIIIKLRKTK